MARCCLNPVNWKDQPDPKRFGWITSFCKVCQRWLGSRPENVKEYRRKK